MIYKYEQYNCSNFQKFDNHITTCLKHCIKQLYLKSLDCNCGSNFKK